MLSICEPVADSFPTGSRRNQASNRNSQTEQDAEHQEDQLDDAKCALHGG